MVAISAVTDARDAPSAKEEMAVMPSKVEINHVARQTGSDDGHGEDYSPGSSSSSNSSSDRDSITDSNDNDNENNRSHHHHHHRHRHHHHHHHHHHNYRRDSSISLEEDDAFGPPTTKREIRAYYSYYVGASGLSLYNYAPVAMQNLLEGAAANSSPPGTLDFLGRRRSVESVVLLANGLAFALQGLLMVTIGAYADLGTGRRWVLMAWSVVGFGVGFAWLAVQEPDRWRAAVGLYIPGMMAYGLTYVYWCACFPSLARASPLMRIARVEHARGRLSQADLDHADEAERSRLSNVALALQSAVGVCILAVAIGLLYAVGYHGAPSVAGLNPAAGAATAGHALAVLIAFTTACWLVLAIPWFLLERTRPGLSVPPGASIILTGMRRLRTAMVAMRRLHQTVIYLAGYFLLGDSLNTTITVVNTLQARVVAYDALQLTYLLLVGLVAQGIGIASFHWIQARFGLGVKTMFNAIMVGIVFLDVWGLAGCWTDLIGFHKPWEFWAYQFIYGIFVCPWWSYSQIVVSSVTPRGFDFLFFSVFNVIGKASSFIGPLISSAIIDASPGPHSGNRPFTFLFALSVASSLFLAAFLDLNRSNREQEAFLAEQERRRNPQDADREP